MSRILLLIVAACSLLLVACEPEPEPEVLAPLDGTIACAQAEDVPVWTFGLGVSGPADEAGAEVLVFSEDLPNDFGYSMVFDGANGTARADFSLTIDGTVAGEDPFPGDVPFACEDLATVQVVFCALDRLSRDETCWACEGAPELPSGADDWMTCS